MIFVKRTLTPDEIPAQLDDDEDMYLNFSKQNLNLITSNTNSIIIEDPSGVVVG